MIELDLPDTTTRYALVLGGTKGLGRQIADRLDTLGLTPIILGRTPRNRAEAPVPDDWKWLCVDLTKVSSHTGKRKAFITRLSPYRHIDCVVWNAATLLKGNITSHDPAEIVRLTEVTFLTPVLIIQALLLAGRHFDLITVGSTTTKKPRPDEPIYKAVKTAQVVFAETFHHELCTKYPDARSLIVNPGGMKTHLWDVIDASLPEAQRFMDPAAVAEIVLERYTAQTPGTILDLTIERSSDGSPMPYMQIL